MKRKSLTRYKRFFYIFNFVVLPSIMLMSCPVRVFAQADLVPSQACLGGCPSPTYAQSLATQQDTGAITPTITLSVSNGAPTSLQATNTPAPSSIIASPTSQPCRDVNHSISSESTDTMHHFGTKKRGGKGDSQSLIQLLLQILQLLFQFFQQLLGISGGVLPSGMGTGPTLPPCPTNTPQPTSQMTPPPSSPPTITTTITGQPTNPASPSAAPVPTGGQIVSPPPTDGGNYSGYYYHITNPVAGDSLSSTFTAVSATCGQGLIAPWPGMGDTWDVEQNLAQLGIDIECNGGGAPVYSTWTEALPAGSVYPANVPVKQGDSITATVTYQGGGKFMTNIKNKTAGWSLDTPMNYSSSYVPIGAEVINEEVGSRGVMQFSPIDFVNVLNVGGQQVQMSAQPQLHRLNMTHSQTSDLNGSNFTSSYK